MQISIRIGLSGAVAGVGEFFVSFPLTEKLSPDLVSITPWKKAVLICENILIHT